MTQHGNCQETDPPGMLAACSDQDQDRPGEEHTHNYPNGKRICTRRSTRQGKENCGEAEPEYACEVPSGPNDSNVPRLERRRRLSGNQRADAQLPKNEQLTQDGVRYSHQYRDDSCCD